MILFCCCPSPSTVHPTDLIVSYSCQATIGLSITICAANDMWFGGSRGKGESAKAVQKAACKSLVPSRHKGHAVYYHLPGVMLFRNTGSKGKCEKGEEWIPKDGLKETEELKILTVFL